jgi:hypothetical protein
MSLRLCVLVFCLAVAACDSATSPTVPLNQDFTLAPGETAAVADAGVAIRFDAVENDSRCPADAICIQGGDAIVRIAVIAVHGQSQEYQLHTGNLQPVQYGSLTIALVQVSPYPFSSRPIRPEEYRVTLRVTK